MGRYYKLVDHVPVPVNVDAEDEDSLVEWASGWRRDRQMAFDTTALTRVSTIFLAIDHDFLCKGPPILFETMVFARYHGDELWQERYCTWDDAMEGHKRLLRKAKRFGFSWAALKSNYEGIRGKV